jgi:hypothetical protein
MFLVMCFSILSTTASVVGMIFRIASYNLRTIIRIVWFRSIYENKTVKDQFVPLICLLSPALTFLSEIQSIVFFRICIR